MLRNFRFAKQLVVTMCSSYSTKTGPKVAVILAGSGHNDGSEIHEAVSILSHLTRNGATPKCFAPDINQMHVIDHSKGSEDESGCRNVLAESARISRGDISPIKELICNLSDYDALFIPGGFGVAKNLSDFAMKGPNMTVDKGVSDALLAFHNSRKPIGLCCISPILAAKLIPHVTVTLGKSCGEEWPFKDTITVAKGFGANIEEKDVLEVAVDECNNVYSTPAFMFGPARYDEVDDGIGNMVKLIMCSLK